MKIEWRPQLFLHLQVGAAPLRRSSRAAHSNEGANSNLIPGRGSIVMWQDKSQEGDGKKGPMEAA